MPVLDIHGNEPDEVRRYRDEHPFTVRTPVVGGQLAFRLCKTFEEAKAVMAEQPEVEGRTAYVCETNICDASAVLQHEKIEEAKRA